MARDRLFSNPVLARRILIAGAVTHFILCVPLYGRRGYPEVDPFWLAMYWLWIPAVPISAVFVEWTRTRAKDLLLYALVTGYIVSLATVMGVPSDRTPVNAVFDLVLFGPMLLIGVCLAEGAARLGLLGIRRFVQSGNCQRSGHSQPDLAEQRCPECGAPFAPELLDPENSPVPTPLIKRWTVGLIILVGIATVILPFVYRWHTFESLKEYGRTRAAADWASGSAIWFMTRQELRVLSPDQQQRITEIIFTPDRSTGFRIETLRDNWQNRTWQIPYREVIEQELAKSGRKPPVAE